jgi:DNA ligase-4
MRGNKEFDKKHLEQLVVKYGGDFCQKRTEDNDATIISSIATSAFILQKVGMPNTDVPSKVSAVQGQIRKGLTILRPEWLVESIKRERMLPLIKE